MYIKPNGYMDNISKYLAGEATLSEIVECCSEDNWDLAGAQAISSNLVSRITTIFKRIDESPNRIHPTPNGSIRFEWSDAERLEFLEIEFYDKRDKAELFFATNDGDRCFFCSNQYIDENKVPEMVEKFYNDELYDYLKSGGNDND